MGLRDRLRYLRHQLNPTAVRREIDEELKAHLEFEIEEKVRSGMSRSEAQRQAHLEFGSLVSAQERCRDVSGFRFLDDLSMDVRYAIRSARSQPVATLVAVVTLGLAIGACTVAFSVVDSYAIRPFPFPDSERLMRVRTLPVGAPAELRRTVPRSLSRLDWPLDETIIEKAVTWDLDVFTVIGDGPPDVLRGAWVPPSYLEVTGVTPVIGRTFSEEEGRAGAPPLAIISHRIWQSRYGGAADVIGRSIAAFTSDRPEEAEAFTIVGVLPADFWFLNSYTEILTNLTEPQLPYLVRLQPGVSPRRAARHLTEIVEAQVPGIDPRWPGILVVSAQADYVERVGRTLLLVSFGVGLVLLVACANVALLLTVRALTRRHEMTLRRALGATRRRVAAQLLTEGLLLSLAAAAVGSLLAWWGIGGLGTVIESQLSVRVPGGPESVRLDLSAFLLALGLGTLTGLLFSLAPIMAAFSADLVSSLGDGGRTVSDSLKAVTGRRAVIIGEVAVSLVLLVAAALMLQSSNYLSRLDLGFEPDNVLTAALSLRGRDYPAPRIAYLADQVLKQLEGTSGVESAAVTAGWPFQDRHGGPVLAGGGPPDDAAPTAAHYVVAGDYFKTMEIALLEGRTFDVFGTEPAPVVIISELLARQLWAGADPLGRRVRLGVEGEEAPERTVIGVVGDVRETLLGDVLPDTYVPLQQSPSVYLYVAARLKTASREQVVTVLSETVASEDATAAVTDVQLMEELVDRQRLRPHFLALILTGFGLFALLLTVVGLYSIVACTVAQRRRDVAIRVAMGARNASVVGLFVRQTFRPMTIGLGVGMLAGAALTRTLETQLYGVEPLDAAAWAAALAVLAVAVSAATVVPALRAVDIDPAEVFRQE